MTSPALNKVSVGKGGKAAVLSLERADVEAISAAASGLGSGPQS